MEPDLSHGKVMELWNRNSKFRTSHAELISPPPVKKPEGTVGLHSVLRLSHQFSGLFLPMLSHIWMNVGSELLYEDLQIKFDFRHG